MPKIRILVACFYLVGCAASNKMAQPPPMSLHVTLERTEFLPGEPVLVAVTVENRGRQVIEHIADLSVETGYLGLFLSRNGGEPARTRTLGAWILYSDGHRLAPGERMCEVINLMEHFDGLIKPFVYQEGAMPIRGTLEPGRYSLRAAFRPLLSQAGHPADLQRIEAEPVVFTVQDNSEIPASEAPALETLRRIGPGYPRSLDQWNEVQARFVESRYLLWLAMAGFNEQDSVDVVPTVIKCLARSRPLTAMAILRQRLMRFQGGLSACQSWLEQREREFQKPELACYLRTWHQEIETKRRHTSSSPGVISGHVSDTSGKPLGHVSIFLRGTNRGAVTNDGGDFTIADVPAGAYTVTSRSLGYAVEDEVVTVVPGKTSTLRFSLKEKPVRLMEGDFRPRRPVHH